MCVERTTSSNCGEIRRPRKQQLPRTRSVAAMTMTTSTSTMTSKKRIRFVTVAAFALASSTPNLVEGFQSVEFGVATATRNQPSHFSDSTTATVTAADIIPETAVDVSWDTSYANSIYSTGWGIDSKISTTTVSQTGFLPWLTLKRDASATQTASLLPSLSNDDAVGQREIKELENFMRDSSFCTETEILKLKLAIDEASGNDESIAAGIARFCLILAETMEMGLNALTAAAFHYGRDIMSSTATTASAVPVAYGTHAVEIAADANRLMHLEQVAGTVIRASSIIQPSAKVRPDKQDAENLRHMLLSETKDWRALAIRSAACLFRLQNLVERASPNPVQLDPVATRMAREALMIFAPLASRLGMHRLKNELEDTAFQILYRRQYETVLMSSSLSNEFDTDDTAVAMGRVLDDIKTELTDLLQNDPAFRSHVEHFEVLARVKEPYSLWKKMLKYGYTHVLQVPDALAVRVVLQSKNTDDDNEDANQSMDRDLCFYAQALCQSRWSPAASNPRFKDYIDTPKPNGYQSLHYTAETTSYSSDEYSNGSSWTFEVQVRSAEMHQVAEFGLASHWDYKLAASSSSETFAQKKGEEMTALLDDKSSVAYLRNVQKWQQRESNSSFDWSYGDGSPASVEPIVLSDIWQSRERTNRMKARTERLEPYLQALTTAQSDLAITHVFVFLQQTGATVAEVEQGIVLALPAGACVLDALREGERALGRPIEYSSPMGELALNGQHTSVTRQLRNGDILRIPFLNEAVAFS